MLFKKNSNDIKYSNMKEILCKIARVSSFIIYHSKYEDTWINAKFVSFD